MKKYFASICLFLLVIFCTWNLANADSSFRTKSMLRSGHPGAVSVVTNDAVGEKVIAVTEVEDVGNTKITDAKITKENADGTEDVMEEVTVEESEKNSRPIEEQSFEEENCDGEYGIATNACCDDSTAECGCDCCFHRRHHRRWRCCAPASCCAPISCCETCGTSVRGNHYAWRHSNWNRSACCETSCCEPACCESSSCDAVCYASDCCVTSRHCGFRCRRMLRRAWRCCRPDFCAPTCYSSCSSTYAAPLYRESIRPTELSRTTAVLPDGSCGCGR